MTNLKRAKRALTVAAHAALVAFMTLSPSALAQDGDLTGGERAEYVSYLFSAADMEFGGGGAMGPRLLEGAASITFEAEDPSQNMVVNAEKIEFFYPEGEAADMPSRIALEGGVDIQHPDGKIRSQRADVEFAGQTMGDTDGLIMNLFGDVSVTTEMGTIQSEVASIDFESGDAVFRRNVRGEGERFQGMVAEEAQMNIRTNYFRMSKAQVRVFDLSSSDPADDVLLTLADISDMAGLLTTIRAEATADGATPGKHLVSTLPQEAQTPILRVEIANLVQQSDLVLKQLNSALRKPAFYDAAAWQGVTTPDAAQTLVHADPENLSEEELVLRNRWLLHAAYPNHVAPPNG